MLSGKFMEPPGEEEEKGAVCGAAAGGDCSGWTAHAAGGFVGSEQVTLAESVDTRTKTRILVRLVCLNYVDRQRETNHNEAAVEGRRPFVLTEASEDRVIRVLRGGK